MDFVTFPKTRGLEKMSKLGKKIGCGGGGVKATSSG